MTLYYLDEKYPDDAETECKNGATVIEIKQTIYECMIKEAATKTDFARVTEATYKIMNENTGLPYYAARSTCKSEEVVKKVCLCPSGFSDYLCETPQQRKCYVQIT